MKFALAQINPTVGDVQGNAQKIIQIIAKHGKDVDVLIFPEMVLTGYPPQDLLFESAFIKATEAALLKIAESVSECTVIVGSVREENGELFNTAAVIHANGKIDYRDKILLPTYDVFDEARYFTSATCVEPVQIMVSGKPVSVGVQICEDLWDDEYSQKVTQQLAEKGASVMVNISASPFCLDRHKERIQEVQAKVGEFKIPFLYCNLVGAQDELVFDGQSFAMNSSGEIVAFGKSFAEDIIFVDIEDSQAVLVSDACEEEQIYNALTLGLKDYFNKTGHSKGIIGLSGGIDSALTCAIAANGLGAENVIGVAMPSQFSSDHSISDAELLANNLGINFETIPIQKLNAQFLNDLDSIFSGIESGLAEENLQARIRGNLLMAIANKKNALVLNTGNKTESALGYCTMYGDMCGALAVISDLNKSQVYSVCRWINEHFGKEVIPEGTLTKPPSAELSPNQVDPFDYDVVSPLVDAIVTDDLHPVGLANAGFDPELATEMMRKVRYSEYKRRQAPPGIRISKKAFGVGRRYPIVNGYTE